MRAEYEFWALFEHYSLFTLSGSTIFKIGSGRAMNNTNTLLCLPNPQTNIRRNAKCVTMPWIRDIQWTFPGGDNNQKVNNLIIFMRIMFWKTRVSRWWCKEHNRTSLPEFNTDEGSFISENVERDRTTLYPFIAPAHEHNPCVSFSCSAI